VSDEQTQLQVTEYAVRVAVGVSDEKAVTLAMQLKDGRVPGGILPPSEARAFGMQMMSYADMAEGHVSADAELECAVSVDTRDGELLLCLSRTDGVQLECPLGPLQVRELWQALVATCASLASREKGAANG
jgi:hypothetical protein